MDQRFLPVPQEADDVLPDLEPRALQQRPPADPERSIELVSQPLCDIDELLIAEHNRVDPHSDNMAKVEERPLRSRLCRRSVEDQFPEFCRREQHIA